MAKKVKEKLETVDKNLAFLSFIVTHVCYR